MVNFCSAYLSRQNSKFIAHGGKHFFSFKRCKITFCQVEYSKTNFVGAHALYDVSDKNEFQWRNNAVDENVQFDDVYRDATILSSFKLYAPTTLVEVRRSFSISTRTWSGIQVRRVGMRLHFDIVIRLTMTFRR